LSTPILFQTAKEKSSRGNRGEGKASEGKGGERHGDGYHAKGFPRAIRKEVRGEGGKGANPKEKAGRKGSEIGSAIRGTIKKGNSPKRLRERKEKTYEKRKKPLLLGLSSEENSRFAENG